MRLLFIDRDGTLIKEPPTEEIRSLGDIEFVPGAIRCLSFLRRHTDFTFALVSNQDGLGTEAYPEEVFRPLHNFIMKTYADQGVTFDAQYIDCHSPKDHHPNRKPGTGMLTEYIEGAKDGKVDLENSYVIGDRETDAQLARNLGCRAVILANPAITSLAPDNSFSARPGESDDKIIYVNSWDEATEIIYGGRRIGEVRRTTKETDIYVRLDLDGTGKCDISTGLGFFDHMLEQIGKHSSSDLTVKVKGDLNVDEHHTIEDTALALGEAIRKALGDKRGIGRYGFCLSMDDCLCQVAIDFGGRPWLVFDAEFKREKIGEMPTEMFLHFFKSLSDAAMMNLNIKAEGQNEHHKIEGIFKALARSIKMAKARDIENFQLPSTKGAL